MTSSRRWFFFTVFLIVAFLVYYLSVVLTPFMIAALLAYLTNPIVNLIHRCRLSRTLAVIIVFVILLTLVFALFFIIVPLLQRQVAWIVTNLPLILQWLQDSVFPWLDKTFGVGQLFDIHNMKMAINEYWQQAGNFSVQIVSAISKSGMLLVGFLVNLLLIPVVLFYLLRDWPALIKGLHDLLPRRSEKTTVKLITECDEVLSAFLRGQLMVMIGLGILYSIGLSIIGLNVALIIGMIAGAVSIIPYLGFIIGIAAAGVAAFLQFHTWWYVLYVFIVFAVSQGIESAVMTPLFVGDKIGLHPVAVIFAVLAGGALFGFVGALLALPAAAVIMVFLRHFRQRYVNSQLYEA